MADNSSASYWDLISIKAIIISTVLFIVLLILYFIFGWDLVRDLLSGPRNSEYGVGLENIEKLSRNSELATYIGWPICYLLTMIVTTFIIQRDFRKNNIIPSLINFLKSFSIIWLVHLAIAIPIAGFMYFFVLRGMSNFDMM